MGADVRLFPPTMFRRVFITNPDGSEYVGQVWPGFTVSFEPATGLPAMSSDPAKLSLRCFPIGSSETLSGGGQTPYVIGVPAGLSFPGYG